MQNQLTDAAIDGFIARSARLSAGAAPLWGGIVILRNEGSAGQWYFVGQ